MKTLSSRDDDRIVVMMVMAEKRR